MDEDDVISEPEDGLEEYTADAEEKNSKPPKNPSGAEAFLIISFLGILPDVIDFFSLGGLSFLSSALSWPATEYYFYKKNLRVPNIRKWIRAMNLGDIIPFLGVIPLKTAGLVMAVYIAWHPDSKLAKGAQALETATGGGKSIRKSPTTSREKISMRAKVGSVGREKEEINEEEDVSLKHKREEDIYEKMDVGGVSGPEEEAETKTFGEIISEPAVAEEAEPAIETKKEGPVTTRRVETSGKAPPLRGSSQKESEETKKKEEEIEERLNIGEVEREIKEKLTSPEAVMKNESVLTLDNERVVDLSGKDK